jgi:hypothetical protein
MKEKWNIKTHLYEANITVNELIDAISVFDKLNKKYPNDETISGAIEILRDEICRMFGGTIYNDAY